MPEYYFTVHATATIEETWKVTAKRRPTALQAEVLLSEQGADIEFVNDRTVGDETDRQFHEFVNPPPPAPKARARSEAELKLRAIQDILIDEQGEWRELRSCADAIMEICEVLK